MDSSSQNSQAPESPPHSIESDHLQNLNLDGFDTAQSLGDGIDIMSEPSGGLGATVLTSEQFYQAVFVPMHSMPAALLKLESLPIKPQEEQSARACSDAIYEIAEETPMFRFLIEPGNIWIQRAVAIGSYAVPKALMVQAELKMKQMKPANKPESKEVH